MKLYRPPLVALVIASSAFAGAPEVHAKPAVVLGDPDVIADVAERVTPSVVSVATVAVAQQAELDPFEELFGRRGRERFGQGLGSGVIVSAKGYILTNNHVVANARDIK